MAENENYEVVEETTEVTEYAPADDGAKKDKWGAFDIALIGEAVIGAVTTTVVAVKYVPKGIKYLWGKVTGKGEENDDEEIVEEVPVEEPKKEKPKKAKKDKKEPIEEVPVKKTVKTVKKKVAKEATEEK